MEDKQQPEDIFAQNTASEAPIGPAATATEPENKLSAQEHAVGQVEQLSAHEDELFQREKMSTKHKIILIVSAVVVVLLLGVGGYFLYNYISDLPAESAVSNSNKNTNAILLLNQNQNLNKANTNTISNTNQIADADNDGLSDADEIKYGTDMKNPDTDGDGYKDGDEVKNGYNPLGSGQLK